jgi:hypothetical protein
MLWGCSVNPSLRPALQRVLCAVVLPQWPNPVAPEIFHSFIMHLRKNVGTVFRSKVWTVDLQDRERDEWKINMIPKRLKFDDIAELVENECRLANVSVDEELKAERRTPAASVQDMKGMMRSRNIFSSFRSTVLTGRLPLCPVSTATVFGPTRSTCVLALLKPSPSRIS